MNWKLIFTLSLFGLAMALATVSLIPDNIEFVFWLVIFIICAAIISKQAPGKYFLHGFVLGLVNCIWVTAAHVLCFKTYMEHHTQMAKMSAQMPMPTHPRLMMLITGPIAGILSGLIIGLFCFIGAKLRKK